MWKNKDIPNNPKGFKKIVDKTEEAAARASGTEPFEIAVGTEATGVYGEKLCCFLHEGSAAQNSDNSHTKTKKLPVKHDKT